MALSAGSEPPDGWSGGDGAIAGLGLAWAEAIPKDFANDVGFVDAALGGSGLNHLPKGFFKAEGDFRGLFVFHGARNLSAFVSQINDISLFKSFLLTFVRNCRTNADMSKIADDAGNAAGEAEEANGLALRITVRMDAETAAALGRYAGRRKRKGSDVVREALARFLEQEGFLPGEQNETLEGRAA